jgi:hypothetical protein
MAEGWALSIRDQCRTAGVPFFFKQWGGFNKKAAGRILEGRTYDEMPPTVARPVPPREERLAMMEQVERDGLRDIIAVFRTGQ